MIREYIVFHYDKMCKYLYIYNWSNEIITPKITLVINPIRNLEKSSLLGINLDHQRVKELADSIGCKAEEWPIKYLGIPLGDNPLKLSFWEPIISKVAKKLAGWKKCFLSKGGRLTLIQSVLDSIPTYYLSLFRIPKNVANLVEKKMRDFLWEGFDGNTSSHLVSWGIVTTSRSLRKMEGWALVIWFLELRVCWESGGGDSTKRGGRYGQE